MTSANFSQEAPVNADQPTILVPEHFGAPFEGGFYGGKIISHGGAKIFAVVWAPKAEGETRLPWHTRYDEIAGAASCWHSMDNTVAMAEAGSELAKWALGLEIAGHKDWCLPARDVLELAYRNLKPGTRENLCSFRDGDNPSSIPAGYPYTEEAPAQTSAEAFRVGGAEAFEEDWYWSSTQFSSYDAWSQDFYSGHQGDNDKKYEALGRAVRLIQLNP
jgi:hypothetical protein